MLWKADARLSGHRLVLPLRATFLVTAGICYAESMRSIAVRRLGASLRRRGITGTVRALWSKVMSLPQERKAAMRRREFDDVYGVDTAEIVHLESLNIESANAIHGVRYQPSDPARFR